MIILGSTALDLRYPHLLTRTPKDLDLVGTEDEYTAWIAKYAATEVSRNDNHAVAHCGPRIIEWEFAREARTTPELIKLVESDPDTLETPAGLVPSLDLLFMLKKSHRFLKDSPHFWKTVQDYHTMKHVGAVVPDRLVPFLKLREKEQYTNKLPKLNQDKANFFSSDQVKYVYDHDTIHESVAFFEKPAYTYYKKDNEEVQCDKNKFFQLAQEIRLSGVAEEAFVLAIERSLVPHPGVLTPRQAWLLALSKVLSSITSGWFREFGYENVYAVLKLYKDDYWHKFQQDKDNGIVRRI